MDRSSYFIKDKALFGSYPTQSAIQELENEGVRYFVDLTYQDEKRITPYKTNYNYISFPIKDRSYPDNIIDFSKFIHNISKIILELENNDKIYIHCKGGHGRSGLVVACILCYLYKISPSEAITKTTKYHNKRKYMKEKWRKIGSPQTRSQKHFITKFFEPLYVYENFSTYFTSDFRNKSNFKVDIPGIGIFPTAEDAFIQLKMKTDENRWKHIMYIILYCKFYNNKILTKKIMNTGLRPIIFNYQDMFWCKQNNQGINICGKILTIVRNELYLKNKLAIFTK